METTEILNILREVFVEVMDDETIALTTETTANDVEGWDSLSHIQLVVSIEKRFKIRFTSKEIQSWNKVGDILNCLSSKLA
jgi:acyl carrier protein